MRTFRLFPADYSWWTFADYDSLLTAIERFRPKRVLEFGPGGSTLALIEGGAQSVDSCEDDPEWLATYQTRIAAKHPAIRLHPFTNADPLRIPALDGQWFDLAFIDGPKRTPTRAAAIAYARERAGVVLCHDAETLARLFGLRFEMVGSVGILLP